MVQKAYALGVDVGTGSVRACLFEIREENKIAKTCSYTKEINIWNPAPDFYEQSSENIWDTVCATVNDVIKSSEIDPGLVRSIGFDATCSVVALDKDEKPISVAVDGNPEKNTILWMDHRATTEAAEINSTQHDLLQYVGGKISVEMELPKLKWIKKNLPDTWNNAGVYFDLPDFLTYKATGTKSRSLCSLVCKWCYDCRNGSLTQHSWSDEFLNKIGVEEFTEHKEMIGIEVLAPGQPVGAGLTIKAAQQLGLKPGIAVGASMIDAHAGGVGSYLAHSADLSSISDINKCISLICGTSSCFMASTTDKLFVPGVWGPYYSAMIPGHWLLEGGQSATGKLLDHVITSHPAYQELKSSHTLSQVHTLLHKNAMEIANTQGCDISAITRHVHVLPDFHGNRSPLADPHMTGCISGLTLSTDLNNLAILYIAALQSLAYGVKHTIDRMIERGCDFERVYMCGGLIKNELYVQTTATILQLPVITPENHDSVLLGAAVLGLSARDGVSITDIICNYSSEGKLYNPDLTNKTQKYHSHKYKIFRMMSDQQKLYRDIMNDE